MTYNENYFNMEQCELIFFTKINAYLLYIILNYINYFSEFHS